MNILDKYNNLRPKKIKLPTVESYFSIPSKTDYERGYITRYFTQRVSDIRSPIYEISGKSFSKFKSSIYYKVTSIKWRISGPLEPLYDDLGNLLDKGVIESNRKSILLEEDTLPNLSSHLKNLKQFHKK